MVSEPRSFRKLLAALGLALMVSLALIATVVAPASALGAPPQNKVKPSISPATPHVGVTETTTNGTWTESPTSYAYQWYRCKSGVCSVISEANKSAYTPTDDDSELQPKD